MSGIPWWTTDVGGYGCGEAHPNDSPYMRELIVRWYQFGCFSPVFRTHGCRSGPSEPDSDQCRPAQGSCGFNEIWSYGEDTQAILEKYVRLRSSLKPYLRALGRKFTARGVPTMRPLAYEFPTDPKCRGIDDQFLLGPEYLVAPVTAQNATTRTMYFPAGARWQSVFHPDQAPRAASSSPSPRRWRRFWHTCACERATAAAAAEVPQERADTVSDIPGGVLLIRRSLTA